MAARYSDRNYDRPYDRDDDRYGRRSDYACGESVSGVTNVENRLRARQGTRTGVMAGTRPADTAVGSAGTTGTTSVAAAGAGPTATGGTGARTT